MTADVHVRIRSQVADELARRRRADEDAGLPPMSAEDQRAMGRHLINEALERLAHEALAEGRPPLDPEEEAELAEAVHDALFGLGALQRLLEDDTIENINANGCDVVWVTRADGTKERVQPLAGSDAELVELIRSAAARVGLSERRFDNASPALNLRLPDGSRLFAVMAVTGRPAVSVRRHRHPQVTLEDLRGLGMMDEAMRDFLAAAVRARQNLIVCGGTGAGKTTLLRALLNEIDSSERLVTIEDSFELELHRSPDRHPDVVALETREPNIEGQGQVTAADLVRMALRMSPDRVIVGEVRGAEVLPMLNAMSQGNDGSMCTVHAHSSESAFSRLAMYAIQAPERLGLEATNLLVANAVDFVVFIAQDAPEAGCGRRRYVASVREVVGADGPVVLSNEVFTVGAEGHVSPAAALRQPTMDALERAGMRRLHAVEAFR